MSITEEKCEHKSRTLLLVQLRGAVAPKQGLIVISIRSVNRCVCRRGERTHWRVGVPVDVVSVFTDSTGVHVYWADVLVGSADAFAQSTSVLVA